MGDFFDFLGAAAEFFGAGELVKRAFSGAGAYASGRSTQTNAGRDDVPGAYVYERVLTRPRDPRINDR